MTEIPITKDMIEWMGGRENANVIDAASVTIDGKQYLIEIEPDLDSSPDDIEGLPEEYLDAWRNDQWWFVGVIVTPLDVPESVQFELSDSLWGLEYEFPLDPPQEVNGRTFRRTTTDYLIMSYPVPDMILGVISKVKAYELQNAIQAFIYS